jgi:7-cyano-7-deazaguanine synthase
MSDKRNDDEIKKHVMLSISGGLDSTTLLYELLNNKYDVSLISFNYGQINNIELCCRERIIKLANERYPGQIVSESVVDLSYMLDTTQAETKSLLEEENSDVCDFYFPSRNMLFTSLTFTYEEIFKLKHKQYDKYYVALGLQKHSTYEDYWDSNISFYKTAKELFKLNPAKIKLIAPFVEYTKTGVVQTALDLDVPIFDTWTCYEPVYDSTNETFRPCNKCKSCIERQVAGEALGIKHINDYEIEL